MRGTVIVVRTCSRSCEGYETRPGIFSSGFILFFVDIYKFKFIEKIQFR